MSDFTIEQLEAMKEKSAEGPWDWGYHEGREVIVDATGEPVLWAEASNSEAFLDVAAGAGHLLVAGLELLDALITEKRAHQKLRKRIEERIRELKQPLCSHMPEGDELDDHLEQWGRQSHEAEILTRILEATNE